MCTSIYGKFLILSIWSIENVHWGRVILDIFSIKLYGQKLYYKITFGFYKFNCKYNNRAIDKNEKNDYYNIKSLHNFV